MIRDAFTVMCVVACMGLGPTVGLAATTLRAVDGNYIVTFAEPPLAAFRGFAGDADPKRAALKATSPAVTGEQQLDVHSTAAKAYRGWLQAQRGEHLRDISTALGRWVEPSLSLDVVNNLAVMRLSAKEAERIADLPGVALVEPEFMRAAKTDAGPQWIGAAQVWNGVNGLSTRGEGVVIGVVDSGINVAHPSFAAVAPVGGYVHINPRGQMFGLCAGNGNPCNTKLIGIYDFTLCTGVHNSSDCNDREANNGRDVDGHGSHVTATAAGNPVNAAITVVGSTVTRQLSGVAPRANIIHYKACEQEEECRGSWVLAAINQAVADRVAVINYSIGAVDARDPWATSDSLAMLNAREAGVVVVVAAGNSGPSAGTIDAPSNAPWVIAAAMTTHDRAFVNRLVDLTGGNTTPPQGGALLGVSLSAGYGPANIVIPLDFPGCSIGTNLDSPPSGVSNPFVGRVFNGEIVVCARGTQARVAKSNNVRLAGGGGMILTNTALEGESIFADEHSIPATHIGFQDGTALRQWLASGSGHRGRLAGPEVSAEPSLADFLNSISGRGPASVEGILKPTISAPGTSILAAAGTGNDFAVLSGTSMATPHVVGTVALIRALKPNWTVSDIESALVTTAQPVIRNSEGTRVATPFEQGSGRVFAANALRAGLSFPVTTAAFRAAHPALGGQPKTLNQAALVEPFCFERCSFNRHVRDLAGGGRWRVEAELTPGARAVVTPTEFDLAAGADQSLQIEMIVDDPVLAGRWVSGGLVLKRVSGPAAADARITVHVFSAPGLLPRVSLFGGADRSVSDVNIAGLIGLPDLTFAVTTFAPLTVRVEASRQDPTNAEVYDSFDSGSFFSLIDVPASAAPAGFRLLTELSSSSAQDVDLFVGEDRDLDGLPEASEELCRSAVSIATERCEIAIAFRPASRRFWVLAQNFRAGLSGTDELRLRTGLVELNADPGSTLTVTAPASIERLQTVPMRLALDAPVSAAGERLVGFIGLSAVAEAPQPFDWMYVEIDRGSDPLAERALVSGRSIDLRLAGNSAAERLFVDVPNNASALTIRSSGAGEVDLYAARVADPTTPIIVAAPPRAQAQVSALGAGANHTLTVDGATLAPGRWYITPVNTAATPTTFSLSTELSYASPRAQPRFGAYFDPSRDGSGVFLFPVGESWGLAWYAYLEDGTPTWYLGAGARPGATQGQWQVDLLRYRWNGSEAIGTRVGEALLSLNQTLGFTFSWSLDSASGSQKLQWIGETRCPNVGGNPLDVTGLWFSPAQPGFGYSVIGSPDFQSVGAYFYDQRGIARWSLGTGVPFSATSIITQDRIGSCPLCSYTVPMLTAETGALNINYSSASMGQFGFVFPAGTPPTTPTPGEWRVDLPAVRLSDAIGCP
ncbi:MAG: S8 family serine peptidase [Pseudomarimonas sp.]